MIKLFNFGILEENLVIHCTPVVWVHCRIELYNGGIELYNGGIELYNGGIELYGDNIYWIV